MTGRASSSFTAKPLSALYEGGLTSGFFRFRTLGESMSDKTDDREHSMGVMGRRAFLKTGATAAVGAAAATGMSGPLLAAAPGKPEVTGAKLGFIALTDAAPLIIAKELGLFAKYGMPDVMVAKQASWAGTRDNLVLGSAGGGIDGAHILSPMPYMLTLGSIGKATPMSILARLNVNGQAISVEKEYLAARADINSARMKPLIV